MTIAEKFEVIATRHSALNPKITIFPSGAAMLDFAIDGVAYCAEFLPSFNAYGLSKTEDSSPFWEGVHESFSTVEALEARICQLQKMNPRANQ